MEKKVSINDIKTYLKYRRSCLSEVRLLSVVTILSASIIVLTSILGASIITAVIVIILVTLDCLFIRKYLKTSAKNKNIWRYSVCGINIFSGEIDFNTTTGFYIKKNEKDMDTFYELFRNDIKKIDTEYLGSDDTTRCIRVISTKDIVKNILKAYVEKDIFRGNIIADDHVFNCLGRAKYTVFGLDDKSDVSYKAEITYEGKDYNKIAALTKIIPTFKHAKEFLKKEDLYRLEIIKL